MDYEFYVRKNKKNKNKKKLENVFVRLTNIIQKM